MDAESVSDLRRSLARIVTVTLAIEGRARSMLWLAWERTVPDPLLRAGWAVFHSVSRSATRDSPSSRGTRR